MTMGGSIYGRMQKSMGMNDGEDEDKKNVEDKITIVSR